MTDTTYNATTGTVNLGPFPGPFAKKPLHPSGSWTKVQFLNANYCTQWDYSIDSDPASLMHKFVMTLKVRHANINKDFVAEMLIDSSFRYSAPNKVVEDARLRLSEELATRALSELNCNVFEPYKPKPKRLQLELIDL